MADGILARLEYDFICNRGGLFGEAHMHGIINEIVRANSDPTRSALRSGFAHPALRNNNEKRGRHREVDFYLEPLVDSGSGLCIEAKWAGSSHCKPENVLIDLCRLTVIASGSPSTDCIFVLAGSATQVDRLFATRSLLSPSGPESRRLLQVPSKKHHRPRTYPLSVDAKPLKAITPNVTVSVPAVPTAIRTQLFSPTFLSSKWQALAWRVTAVEDFGRD